MSESNTVEVVPLGRSRYLVNDGRTRRVAFAVVARDAWVFLDGRVYVVPLETGVQRAAAGADDTALTAPMPATVIAIPVSAGQTVARGDVLVVLEAMKMELVVQAPRDGQVTRIACAVGDLVQPGVALLELSAG